MTERFGHSDSTPPYTARLIANLEKLGRYDLIGELTEQGIVGDYWNTFFAVHQNAHAVLHNRTDSTVGYLRDTLSATRTYTQYCIDRFAPPDYDTNPQSQASFTPTLTALIALDSARQLDETAGTYREATDKPLPNERLEELINLAKKSYVTIYGEERARRAGVIE